MWPTRTPKDRDGTAWQGHSWAWRARVMQGEGEVGIVYGIAEVSVVREVSMNFEFIEGRETRDKVVKFGGVGITDEEIVNDKGKRGGVGVVAE